MPLIMTTGCEASFFGYFRARILLTTRESSYMKCPGFARGGRGGGGGRRSRLELTCTLQPLTTCKQIPPSGDKRPYLHKHSSLSTYTHLTHNLMSCMHAHTKKREYSLQTIQHACTRAYMMTHIHTNKTQFCANTQQSAFILCILVSKQGKRA